jgi:hypothetical protein
MHSIFLSHSSKDNDLTGQLKERLEAYGCSSLFLDIDDEAGIWGRWEHMPGAYQRRSQRHPVHHGERLNADCSYGFASFHCFELGWKIDIPKSAFL